ncbi:MAG TPA: hypothetical protein VHF47_02785 [Acidimicrobiales bacterium]|nr:hypothetical protein [Acidimicrobiales bacterium]
MLGDTAMRHIRLFLTAVFLVLLAGPLPAARPAEEGSVGAAAVPAAPAATGYWLVASDGGIFAFGGAAFHGSMGGTRLNRPMVGMASTLTGRGYWTVATDGGVFSFGDARFFGSTGAIRLNQPIVGMAATPSGAGYWLVASDGGIFAFGDAVFAGSTGNIRLNRPIVGMAPTPSGLGYWLVASDGGIFAFGDARFFGSTGAIRLVQPITAMAPSPSGLGYYLVAADGGVFAFGDALFRGSMGAANLGGVVSGAATPRGIGYWMVSRAGGLFTFGDAPFLGSAGTLRLAAPIVGMAAAPVRFGAEVSAFYYPWYATLPHDREWRHWEGHGHFGAPADIPADFYPARGVYSSASAAVLDAHMAELRAAGVDVVVSSWWGRGSWEDQRLPQVLAAARNHGLRVAAHLEPYSGRSPASVADDLAHLRNLGVTEAYVYDVMSGAPEAWQGVTGNAHGMRLWAEEGSVANVLSGAFARWARTAGFDGLYTYDPIRYTRTQFGTACGTARMHRLLCSPSVAPGHSAMRTFPGRPVVKRDGGARYNAHWTGALAAGADSVSITSYNEWHEGTQIEGAVPYCFPDGFCSPGYEGEYGRNGEAATRAYLDATAAWAAVFRALRG